MKIHTRIALLVIFLTTGLGLVIFLTEADLLNNHINSTQTEWVETVARTVAETVTLETINNEKFQTRQQLQQIVKREKSLAYMYIVDFEGRLFTHTFDGGFPKALVPGLFTPETFNNKPLSSSLRSQTIGNIQEIIVPLIPGMDGRLYFGVDQSNIKSLLETAKTDLIINVALVIVIGIFIALWVGNRISRPIQTLSDQVHRYSIKGKIQKINVDTNEPFIKGLTDQFNEMVTIRSNIEAALYDSEENLRTTFASIGDGVITTDTQGNVTRMNDIAEKLTGWELKDTIKKPLDTTFHIINAKTREPAINPVNTVIENGKTVGLANHTILISKNKRELQIADSAAPIKNDEGLITGVVLVFRDVTEEYAVRDALYESEHNLSLHMENTPIGVLNWDQNLTCTRWNPAAEQIFGFTAEEAIGGQADVLIAPQGSEQKKLSIVEILLTPQENRQVQIETVTRDGRKVICEWFNTPIMDDNGKLTGIASLVQDISYRIEIENELRNALIDAERANQAKTEFLATMSHEFRTPLNAILGFSEMLVAQYFGPLGAENYKTYAHDIHSSGQHMLELVNDVLDVSAIEAGTRLLDRTTINPEKTIDTSIHNISHMAKQKSIKLINNTPKPLPIVVADKRTIAQVLLNLLSNAIKFTEAGGEIAIETTYRGETLKIKVIDTGIGIPKDKTAMITEPFTQLENNPHHAQEGTGLGLSIVKSLVENHGGGIKIKSKLGKGTEVTVTFKCEKSNKRTKVP